MASSSWILLCLCLASFGACMAAASHIGLGSRLLASEEQTWVSDNGTFAFGFTPAERRDQFELAIWFAELPGDRTLVWSANRNSPVTNNAVLELDTTGNLVLIDGDATVWMSNTSGARVEYAVMSESGNFILYNTPNYTVWQSFSYPTDTLLPNQPLTVSLELTTSNSASQGGYYTLKMLQQPNSLTLALTYNLPETYNNLPESFTNYSYWQAPDISNVTGDVVAVLDDAGSFGIFYGEFSDGAVYVYKNDNDKGELSATSNMTTRSMVLRRLSLESNGNIRLYRWDDDVNGSRQWVPEWAAVSNPCDIAGICGNGVCNLDRSKTNASCTCLPGTSKVEGSSQCSENSSLIGKCDSQHKYPTSEFRISTVQQTNYYYSDFSVIANYSDIATVSKCGDACLSDCDCVASIYGLDDEKPYCWVLRSLDFGGFEDSSSTLFVKVSYRELQTRTWNFSQLLGIGGFGSVYKGSLADGTLVAVKKLDRVLPHGETEFITEVNTIGSMHHMNLVRLCGYCSEGTQRLLVYEFMKNGRNLDMSFDAENFFYPGWAFKEMTNGTPIKVADRRLQGAADEEELVRALKVAFWCIQDEVFTRPSMGEVVKMLEGSIDHINMPPMPQTVLELIEEGLDQVYKAMKREVTPFSSFTINSHHSSQATCSYSTMSPR
nr:g-type lectin s-receptor-like serine/threonine-protein kinase [Quercus suber]